MKFVQLDLRNLLKQSSVTSDETMLILHSFAISKISVDPQIIHFLTKTQKNLTSKTFSHLSASLQAHSRGTCLSFFQNFDESREFDICELCDIYSLISMNFGIQCLSSCISNFPYKGFFDYKMNSIDDEMSSEEKLDYVYQNLIHEVTKESKVLMRIYRTCRQYRWRPKAEQREFLQAKSRGWIVDNKVFDFSPIPRRRTFSKSFCCEIDYFTIYSKLVKKLAKEMFRVSRQFGGINFDLLQPLLPSWEGKTEVFRRSEFKDIYDRILTSTMCFNLNSKFLLSLTLETLRNLKRILILSTYTFLPTRQLITCDEIRKLHSGEN